jgi:orotate phosphoribosyltransferase
LFAEREEERMALRRGFKIKKGEKVLIVEDVITTGGAVQEVKQLVEGLGGEVVGIGALIDRRMDVTQYNIHPVALSTIKIETYDPAECPLCRDRIPLVKHGSRKL